MSSIAALIERKVRDGLSVAHLALENESHMHSGPATDSHFRMVVVSDAFDGLRLVQRHQRIYALVAEELAGPVHALALHTFTPAEWAERGEQAEASPNCRGGSQAG
ncbi:bolA protein [Alcanivorax sp. S71-1-4]|uniref:BolA family protein n=1 Tax=Alcanivorax sp. S71-1-4 TaxID=1177159 RepID=UPI00135C0B56|nr:BolA/IbaG family iron-sulfur metabolism protein [Alcanivorax sp. S71-1-4]KAF0809206.1 bolA protein [Alcanivorax sp. S71-1-4]